MLAKRDAPENVRFLRLSAMGISEILSVHWSASMAPEFGKPIQQLPLIPAKVVKQHRVHEPVDTRFRSRRPLALKSAGQIAKRANRPSPQRFAREGDILVVTKIDRLARSVRHLCEITDRLQAKGVALRILNMNLDTNDATGKLMLQIIGSTAEVRKKHHVVAPVGRHRQGKGGRQISWRHPHSSRQS